MSRWVPGFFVLAAVFALAQPAAADEPVRIERYDADAYPPRGTGTRLVLGGAGATAFWYGAAVGISYLNPNKPGADDLRIPIAGPWMTLADTGCSPRNPQCGIFGRVLRAIFVTIDGVGQAGGVLVMGEGIFLRTSSAPPRTQPRPQPPKLRRKPTVSAAPIVTGDVLGVSVFGRF